MERLNLRQVYGSPQLYQFAKCESKQKKKKKVDKCSPAPLDSLQSVKGLFNPDSRASPLWEVPAVLLLPGEQRERRCKATEYHRKVLLKSLKDDQQEHTTQIQHIPKILIRLDLIMREPP